MSGIFFLVSLIENKQAMVTFFWVILRGCFLSGYLPNGQQCNKGKWFF